MPNHQPTDPIGSARTTTVVVIQRWPWWCANHDVPLHLSRSIAEGLCCCCREDHAPDARVDVVQDDAAGIASLPVARSA